ncbi:acetoin utilization protein AcuC [Streptosporangium sp. NBC_01755]|uniref:acetoin utilization protein AcuC n=1 Tax=unclassified Streptosporangium TaxID=2632669 RepID=UPI002DD8F465|nr:MULTISPECIES: acetoin utilization protein AcuC [unclassified Streptosporangium]WSA24865.1 acetoin utilization protein AcuC [Streptosporangium sp. NBC_01810]WSD03952.1 acetoin utilization protein AcuC [Streptosporangium sp. NBC_01755]
MSRSVRVVWDDALISYDFGPGHPLAPVRVELTMALARELGVLDLVEMSGCAPATDDELALVHKRDYIEAVKRVSATGRRDLAYGLGTEDNPAFAGVHEASALITGASLAAARAVWTGEVEHAVNIAGGLHHAMAASASGFCVYNDPGAAIAWLLAQGASRVAYVDVDVHHGDGVQAMFYDDPRVLTISLHESPRTLFPGTGFPEECGVEGTAVNVALPAGCGDSDWLRAFHAVVPPLLREFAPDVLVTQHGCDSHALDPLANLMLSLDGQRAAYAALHELAHETAGGRWVVTGGGGYELVQVVPRAWTHLLAEVAGHPLDPRTTTPETWRKFVKERTDQSAPLTLTDGRNPEFRYFSTGYDPADSIDRAIMATRKAVFPFHGLDPFP